MPNYSSLGPGKLYNAGGDPYDWGSMYHRTADGGMTNLAGVSEIPHTAMAAYYNSLGDRRDTSRETYQQPSFGMYSQPSSPGGNIYSPTAVNYSSTPLGGMKQTTVGDLSQTIQEGNASPFLVAQQQADASKFGAEAAAGASRYGSQQQADAAKFAAQQQAEASRYGNLTGLMGSQRQSEAQEAIAQTNIQPGMEKLRMQSQEYFPFLKEWIAKQGGAGGGSSYSGQLMSSALGATSPAAEQAAMNAIDARFARQAASSALNQRGQLAGTSGSPLQYALTSAGNAAAARAGEEAKLKARSDFSQQRVSNLASAIAGRSSEMAPIYAMFNNLLG